MGEKGRTTGSAGTVAVTGELQPFLVPKGVNKDKSGAIGQEVGSPVLVALKWRLDSGSHRTHTRTQPEQVTRANL
jgi:hypothetical protein